MCVGDECPLSLIIVVVLASLAGSFLCSLCEAALYGNAWLSAASAVFALTMLLLAEIVPKSVCLAWAEKLAILLAWPIQMMVWIVYPLAILCRWLSRMINGHAPGQQHSIH